MRTTLFELLRLRLTADGRLRSRLKCSPPFTGFGTFLAAALARGSFTCGCALGGNRLASLGSKRFDTFGKATDRPNRPK